MAPCTLPAPCIVALRAPVVGGPRPIDTSTRIELLCDTPLAHELFYTLDGRRPEPYWAGVLQGGKPRKYARPFRLPPGKITVRAIAVLQKVHTVRSSVVTKQFEVLERPGYRKERKRKSCVTNGAHESNITIESHVTAECNITPESNGAGVCERIPSPPFSDIERHLPDVAEFSDSEVEESLPSESEGTCRGESEAPFLPQIEGLAKEEDAPVIGFPEDEETLVLAGSDLEVQPTAPFFPRCDRCDTLLQNCPSCSSLNAATSRHCVQCGAPLALACAGCSTNNPVTAPFCHKCGMARTKDAVSAPQVECANSCTMTDKTRTCSAGVQRSLSLCDRQCQTEPGAPPKSRKKMPPHSPGRGYWHQQLDYICNHLKAYAYNDEEFRRSISSPVLSEFRSAELLQTDDNITIVLSFAPLNLGKEDKDDL